MNEEIKFMRMAYKEALKALKKDEVPVGCVLVKDHKVLARGYNQKEAKQDPMAHAEIIAIQKACKKLHTWRLKDVSLYVTLEPCSMCAGAILQSRIEKVFYGTEDPKGGALGSSFHLFEQKNLNHHPEIKKGILKKECSELLTNYFKTKRK